MGQLDQWRPFLFFIFFFFSTVPAASVFARQTLVVVISKASPDPTSEYSSASRSSVGISAVYWPATCGGVFCMNEIFSLPSAFFPKRTNGSHALWHAHWFLPGDSIKTWFIDGKIRFNSATPGCGALRYQRRRRRGWNRQQHKYKPPWKSFRIQSPSLFSTLIQ